MGLIQHSVRWRPDLGQCPAYGYLWDSFHPRRCPAEGSLVANIKSQIKRNRTNEKARLRNKSVKSSLKTAVRKFREAADAGSADAQALAREANKALDKAASKGVIHANQAANRKSAIAKRAEAL
jgi:small subunit ribosomal protein S20